MYTQSCPDCGYGLIINNEKDALKICPKCKGKKIVYRVFKNENVIGKNCERKEINTFEYEDEKIEPFAEIIQEDIDNIRSTYRDNEVVLRYIRGGIIQSDFEIVISPDMTECVLGRDGIGREYFCADTRVSNEHLYVIYRNGIWFIKDEKSTNGTMINNVLIQKKLETEIKDGDIITLGKTINSVKLKVILDVVS